MACLSFIEHNPEWMLCREFKELAVSGYKRDIYSREYLKRIVRGAKSKEFDVLVVFMLDRLGRKVEDMKKFYNILREHGIEIWSVVEGEIKNFHLNEFFYFQQSFKEVEKISTRVKIRTEQLNKEGSFTGGTPPFGYRLEKKNGKTVLAINPEESQIVKEIFNLAYENRYGCSKIAQILNQKEIKTRSKKMWIYSTISRLLRNPIYIGQQAYNKTDDRGRKIERDQWKLKPKKLELVIIPDNVFYGVQQLLDKRKALLKTSNNSVKEEFLLNGIATCGYCGRKLKAENNYNSYYCPITGEKFKRIYRRYVCEHAKNKLEFHGQRDFGADKYERLVISQIIQLINNKEIKIKNENSLISQRKECLAQINFLKQKLQEKYLLLFAARKNNCNLSEIEKDIENLNNDLEKREKHYKDCTLKLKELTVLKEELPIWEENFRKGNFAMKREMLNRIIENLLLRKDTCELKLNVSMSFN